jgi:ATP-dependent Lon protease
MLNYTAIFKNNTNKMKNSKESLNLKKNVPITRSQKRKLNKSNLSNDKNVNKKYKNNIDNRNSDCSDNSDGSDNSDNRNSDCSDESEDNDYIPDSTESEEESSSDSISESENEENGNEENEKEENGKEENENEENEKEENGNGKEENENEENEKEENEKEENGNGKEENGKENEKENVNNYEEYLENLAEEMEEIKIPRNKKLNINPQCIPCIKPIKEYNLRKNDSNSITSEEKKYIEEVEKEIFELNKHKIPPRHKILLSQMSLSSKAKVIESMDLIETMNSYSSEYSKLSRWIDGILQVPFGKYTELPISLTSPNEEIISYLSNIEHVMDECIFGQQTAKEKILEFVGKWITNPNSTNEPLAFIGDKGTGKTTLAKEGVAKALGRPFYMISLGGESDASSFKGHDYTYEGSRCGKIVDILISTQCMNPVIFFDELDKISTTNAGEEIAGMLMHLTDTTQNDSFSDKYFSGINFDLSKAMFIFSYNDPEKLNPILRDRLTEIKFTPFKKNEKLIISKNFLIKRACENIGLKKENYILDDDTISNLIEKYTVNDDSGVRNIKRVIETLFLRINLFHLPQKLNISYKNINIKIKEGKYIITNEIISEMLKDIIPCTPGYVYSMYS